MRQKKGFATVIFCMVFMAWALGCGRSGDQYVVRTQAASPEFSPGEAVKTTTQNLSMAKNLKDTSPRDYVLGPGDEVGISVLGHSELSIEERISSLGTISYYLLGEIEAGGLTRFELRDKIREGLGKYIKHPEVIVRVTDYQSQKVVVLGQVEKPGTYYLKGYFSLLEALTSAGGITSSANLRGAYVVRDGKVLLVNFFELVQYGKTEENIPLLPDDVIYIPDNRDLKVFVLGEVNRQSSVPLSPGMTLFGAIAEAGGFTRDAAKKSIVVMRGNLSEPEILLINANEMRPEANVPLELGDVVYVSSTTFADIERIGIRLSHILRPFYDVARTVVYGDAAVGVLFENKDSRILIEE